VRAPRLYASAHLETGASIVLESSAAHYLTRVLRLSAGARVILFNGLGGEYEATLAAGEGAGCIAEVGQFRAWEAESPLHIRLLQAISRAERMDYTVQKAVELGVQEFVPVIAERCQVRLDGTRAERRLQHWRNIMVSACQQCGRNRIPDLHPPMVVAQALSDAFEGSKLVLDPGAGASLARTPPVRGRVMLLTGPEGGFTEGEIALAVACGFARVRVGPRILRTETVALATVAALQALWGDLAGCREHAGPESCSAGPSGG
jgi:16S rRNA (uracil1498-N3)-methyltransferase